ncbi:MAG: transcription termination factor NusA [Elusimicrobia bacterium]|nr:transcription termination factor NusA [Candidatus Liberimonas magnetica]
MPEKSEMILALEQIEKDKGIPKGDIIKVIENALVSAYKKHVGKDVNVEAVVNPESGEMGAVVIKKVVLELKNPSLEITLDEAKAIKSDIKLDEDLRMPLDTQDFSRIAAQIAKQVIVQKIRESERQSLFDDYKGKVGLMVNGVVWRFANRNIIVDLGKTEAILPVSEQISKEKFNLGQHVRAIIVKVEKGSRGPVVVLSRSHPDLVKRLFEVEVPEIYEKIVEIVNVVREKGMRAKVAVTSNNPKVDPVGACVGIKGARVKPIIDELFGERIDLIPFSNDPERYIASSLSPAKVTRVNLISKEAKKAEVIVNDEMLSLAIGKSGHNVRLAAKLVGWHIDIRSESQKKKETEQNNTVVSENLSKLKGVGQKTVEVLTKAGFIDINKLANAKIDDLTTLQGIGEKTAKKIIDSAKELINTKLQEAKETETKATETDEAPAAKPKTKEKSSKKEE